MENKTKFGLEINIIFFIILKVHSNYNKYELLQTIKVQI